jgi:hypothetical protein
MSTQIRQPICAGALRDDRLPTGFRAKAQSRKVAKGDNREESSRRIRALRGRQYIVLLAAWREINSPTTSIAELVALLMARITWPPRGHDFGCSILLGRIRSASRRCPLVKRHKQTVDRKWRGIKHASGEITSSSSNEIAVQSTGLPLATDRRGQSADRGCGLVYRQALGQNLGDLFVEGV